MLSTEGKLRHLGMNINGEYLLCNTIEENIDQIFINYDLVFNVWITIDTNVLPLLILMIRFVDWLEYV